MTKLEKLINDLIRGERNCWYFDFEIGDVHIGGGYFYAKADARRVLKVKLRKIITDDSVLVEYLSAGVRI